MANLLRFPDAALKRRLKEEGERAAQVMFCKKMTHEALDILEHLPIEYVYKIFDRATRLISEYEAE